MKRFMGLMPSSEVEIERHYNEGIIIQAGKHGWTIIWSDQSSKWEDIDNEPSVNFEIAYSKALESVGSLTLSDCGESNLNVVEACNGISNKLTIKIKYADPDILRISRSKNGDFIDLRASETVHLKAGEFKEIPLGVAMELPKGYEAWLVSRSSLTKNFGVIHCDDLGVIDNSYKGDNDYWKLPVVAIRDTTINKNDRICQFRIHRNMPSSLNIIEVERLNNPDRGGLGSSGIK